jgi:hypothetical protein
MAKLPNDLLTPTYKRPSIAGWLTPMLLGPWLSIALVVSGYAFLGPEWAYVPRWGVWGVGMLVGALMGALYIAAAALLDVVLLALRISALPNGKRAWLGALVPPLGFMASYLVIKPWSFWKGGPWTVVGSLLLPPVVAAFASRLVLRKSLKS